MFDGLPRTHDANAHGDDHAAGACAAPTSRRSAVAARRALRGAAAPATAGACACCSTLVEDLNTLPLRARLAKQILLLARSYGVPNLADGSEMRIGLQLAQEDLAQLLGASRQRVNQELKAHRARGRDPHRADAAGGAGPRGADAHLRSRRPITARAARHDPGLRQLRRHHAPSPSSTPSTSARSSACLAERTCAGFAGPAHGRAVQGRPVEPDLQADHAGAQLRDARQARPGGQAAALGARDRARVHGHARPRRHRRAGAAHATACARTRPSSAAPST